MEPLSTEALQLLARILEEAEQELSIRGDAKSLEALDEIWALYTEQFQA